MKRSNLRIALLASLLVHLALLWALLQLAPRPAPVPERLQVTFIELEPSTVPETEPLRPPAPLKPRTRRAPAATSPGEATPPPAAAPEPAPEGAGDGNAEEQGAIARSGEGARLDLTPPTGTWTRLPSEALDPGGRTIRNGPGAEPDPSAVAAYNAERARRKIQGFAELDLAGARGQNGIVDSYYAGMQRALQKEATDSPGLGDNPVQNLLQGWGGALAQYGKTGNPYAAGEVPEIPRAIEDNSPLAQAAAQDTSGQGSKRLYEANRMNALIRDFANGKFGDRFVAVVEIRQNGKGEHQATLLLESSGNPVFDKHVVEVAPLALQTLPAPPEKGPGIHAEGLRTHWAFEGRIVYLRKLSKDHPPEAGDLLNLGVTSLLGSLTGLPLGMNGQYDETTGETEIVDFSRASLRTRVRLLRVF